MIFFMHWNFLIEYSSLFVIFLSSFCKEVVLGCHSMINIYVMTKPIRKDWWDISLYRYRNCKQWSHENDERDFQLCWIQKLLFLECMGWLATYANTVIVKTALSRCCQCFIIWGAFINFIGAVRWSSYTI